MFWGSNTGNQEEGAGFLKDFMEAEGVEMDEYNIADTDPKKMLEYKRLIIGLIIVSIIPNHYNPMHIAWWRLLIRLAFYIFIVIRIKKQTGLPISKYLIWSWIFFVNEISWIIIPFQIVYDTYNYKIDINV